MSLRSRTKYIIPDKPAPRAGVTLFAARDTLDSHWARLVLAEKDVDGARLEIVAPGKPNHDLAVLNPAMTLPTLVDRDTVIHPASVVVEYLDERYPHPKLLPADPAARARVRMAVQRIEHDFFPLVPRIQRGPAADAKAARKLLADHLTTSARMFPVRGWFLGQDYNLADCALAVLFHQLPPLGLKLPADMQVMVKYAERLFMRPAFQRTLR